MTRLPSTFNSTEVLQGQTSILHRDGLQLTVVDPEISKRGEPASERGATPQNRKKITYFGSEILSFTNI
jgi:hypothetical protein